MRRLVLILALLAFGCVQDAIVLEATEVSQYQGQELSSIDDFRENSIRGPQHIDTDSYTLKVAGQEQAVYTYDEVLQHQRYSKVVRLNCVEGWSVNILWEGVLVRDLVMEAQILPGADTIIFYASDGYSTSFPLDYIMDNDIILAYKMNNVTLPPERGYPFQLVAQDKWGYKWIKWVTAIELSDNENYTGYWETRGYSNSGDLDRDFFE